jgi:hypothetical protein
MVGWFDGSSVYALKNLLPWKTKHSPSPIFLPPIRQILRSRKMFLYYACSLWMTVIAGFLDVILNEPTCTFDLEDGSVSEESVAMEDTFSVLGTGCKQHSFSLNKTNPKPIL